MPFDPKLIRPENAPLDTDGELQLSGDLAAMAEQLRDDARHLSRVYPPARVSKTARRRVTFRRSLWTASMGTAVAAALVAVLALWRDSTSDVAPAKAPRQAQSTFAGVASPAASSVSLTELSAPEIEAVLDMLEHDNSRPASVSF